MKEKVEWVEVKETAQDFAGATIEAGTATLLDNLPAALALPLRDNWERGCQHSCSNANRWITWRRGTRFFRCKAVFSTKAI